MKMNVLFEIGLCCGIVAYVYAQVLTQDGQIFHGLYKWLEGILVRTEVVGGREVRHENFFWKPLIGCFMCVAGQMAFWYFLWFSYKVHHYNILHHILVVCVAILTTVIIHRYVENN